METPEARRLREMELELKALRREQTERHEDNLERFSKIEVAAAALRGQFMVVNLLLAAVVATNLAHLL